MKIMKSLAIIAAVVALAGGATYALWNDTATITGSTFSTTTSDLMIDKDVSSAAYSWSDGFTVDEVFGTGFAFKGLYPGYPTNPGMNAGQERNWQVIDLKNVGEASGLATIQLVPTTWSALGDYLVFTITYDGDHDGIFEKQVASGTLAQFNGNTYTLGQMTGPSDNATPGKLASVRIEWSVLKTAGNDTKNTSVTIDTVFGLSQGQ